MNGLSEMACPSCGGRDVDFNGGRLQCRTCGWTPTAAWLAGELGWRTAAFRNVTALLEEALGQGGSPIEAMRCEQQQTVLALEIAQLHALAVPVLV